MLFRVCTILSALLFVACIGLWYVTRTRGMHFSYGSLNARHEARTREVMVGHGGIGIAISHYAHDWYELDDSMKGGWPLGFRFDRYLANRPACLLEFPDTAAEQAGFIYEYENIASFGLEDTYVAFPVWSVLPVFAFLPFLWLIARFLRRNRRRPGHCRACGYDLRATPNQCPECGTIASGPLSPVLRGVG